MTHVERNDALKDNNKIALQRYQFAIECLGKESKVVADLGSGFGWGSHLLRQAGHNVNGYDKSLEAIEYANKNYPGAYNVANLENSFFDGFDAAVCLEVLCHLKNPQAFIDRLTMQELIISAPIDPDPNDGYIYRLHNLSEEQFKELLKYWEIVKEFRQNKYLTLHCKKI